MFTSGIRAMSNVHLELFDHYGNLKEERWAHNIIPTVGLAHIADQLASTPVQAAMSHMAVGLSGTAPASGQTLLIDETAKVALTSRTASAAVVTYVSTFGAGIGTGALLEAGIFNSAAASAGTMLARLTFLVINKEAADSLQVTWTVSASDDGV